MNVIRDCLPKVCRVKNQPQASLPSRQEVTEETRKPKKKALLIGVQYMTMGENALKGPHKDVAAMRKLLIEKYQYNPKDIVVLKDTKNSKQKQPTRDNLVAEMKNLVHEAAPGDRFFFHYAGHALQVPTTDRKEEDGMDECIIPCDSNGTPNDPKLIKDDLLKEILVDKLPTGCHLVFAKTQHCSTPE
ncbi:hypothetical protein AAF712_012974 [Marasmius tenuissimus]|uniref:Peptidase C14 caspase domain-containing protein n=1 Tax=Marasmius tenuissimus TaxID=585030 RepID=A0ABR2ZGX6_9AGAR